MVTAPQLIEAPRGLDDAKGASRRDGPAVGDERDRRWPAALISISREGSPPAWEEGPSRNGCGSAREARRSRSRREAGGRVPENSAMKLVRAAARIAIRTPMPRMGSPPTQHKLLPVVADCQLFLGQNSVWWRRFDERYICSLNVVHRVNLPYC